MVNAAGKPVIANGLFPASNQTEYNRCMFKIKYEWLDQSRIKAKQFTCGHCGHPLASEKGYKARLQDARNSDYHPFLYVCHFCTRPTFFDAETRQQWPGASFGNDVLNISDENVQRLYNEARRCITTNSFTASVMCSRKLLMNIAVSKGATKNQSFAKYVDYLSDSNYIPAGSKDWVDHIRSKGNDANHEIAVMKREDAEELISFSEMLLKLIYEFPARIKSKSAPGVEEDGQTQA
jgi:hypothetical protein